MCTGLINGIGCCGKRDYKDHKKILSISAQTSKVLGRSHRVLRVSGTSREEAEHEGTEFLMNLEYYFRKLPV